MPTVEHSALVPFAPRQMYELVNGIDAYPRFLPWCSAAQVHERTPTSLRATLQIQKGPLKQRLTTVNTMSPDQQIRIQLQDGPFRHLRGVWDFKAAGDCGCEVRLHMDYEFSNRWIEKTLGRVFAEITHTLVNAFCQQARSRYGAK